MLRGPDVKLLILVFAIIVVNTLISATSPVEPARWVRAAPRPGVALIGTVVLRV